jgi:hypothetical protein
MNIDTPEILETYRHQLCDAIERDLARAALPARLKRHALALVISASAATATAAAVLLTAAGGGPAPLAGPALASAAIIRHVRAELTAPAGSILHEAATVTRGDGSSMRFELWAQTGGTGVYRVIKDGQEVSLSATQNEIYDPSTQTVTVSPLPPAVHAREVSRSGDLAVELKQMVDSGQATATQTTFDGIAAYELRLNASDGNVPSGTAYVAQSDYRPLEIDSTASNGDKIVFSAYDYMPATPANDALLAVTTAHPGARVVNQAGQS